MFRRIHPMWSTAAIGGAALCLAAALATSATASATSGRLVDAWGTAPQSSAFGTSPVVFNNQTLRLIVHLHASGSALRVRLNNYYGTQNALIGRVTVAVRKSGATLAAAPVQVPFKGATSFTVPAGANSVTSDEVPLTVKAGQDVAVDIYLPSKVTNPSWHHSAEQTSYVSTTGDHSRDTSANAFPTTIGSWPLLTALTVRSATSPGTIAALGDSITDGSHSTSNTNGRWPDVLSNRLLAAGPPYSVVDEGIAGNNVLTDGDATGQSALNRLSRDVLVRWNLKYVILFEGINDLKGTEQATASQLTAGYQQIIDQVHAKGAKIIGATIMPFEGSSAYTAAAEKQREAVNAWIKTPGHFDGVIDFSTTMQDPSDHLHINPTYDSGDHLHPNEAGYQKMGNSISLSLFQ